MTEEEKNLDSAPIATTKTPMTLHQRKLTCECGAVYFRECDCLYGPDSCSQTISVCSKCRQEKGRIKAIAHIKQAIGPRYQNATLGDFEGKIKWTLPRMTQTLSDCFKNGQNLYIWGSLGSGKTHFAAALIRYFGVNHLSPLEGWCIYLRGKDLADMEKDEDNNLRGYLRSPLVIIDELVTPGEYRAERLFLFVDERYSRQLLTIGISNYGAEQIMAGDSQLGQDFGPKIISRLTRDEGSSIWEIKGR